jgi:nucleotide-binding universal stress UspA family protein
MISRVLVGTGGSEWSESAVEYAAQYAANQGAELIILHVVDTVVYPASEERRARGEAILARAEELIKPYDVGAVARLGEGPIADTVVDVAKETDADFVVLGAKGEAGVKERLVGHIIGQVLAIAPCPVMIVRQQETLAEMLKVGRDKVVFREKASRRR